MSKESITLSYKQIGAIALVLINIILIGPGGWTLKEFWSQAKTFKTDTELKLDDLDDEIQKLNVKLSSKFVTKESFAQYKEQMGETIRHLDSKITP